jgi:two-component system, cell cycle sensor histidine kinase and response regulator CckA
MYMGDAQSGSGPLANPSKAKVLLIDDEELIVRLLSRSLQHFGIEVLSASTGKGGVLCFQENCSCIRAIVLDLSLPDQSWEEIIRQVRQIDPTIQIIISSGQFTDQDFTSYSITAVLNKPFPVEDLVRVLESDAK